MNQVSATPTERPDPIRTFVESGSFQAFILFVIVVNAIVLGLATSSNIMERMGGWISVTDKVCLYIFIAEMFLKLLVYRHRYFKDGWNVFDFLIIGISIPSLLGLDFLGNISILRALGGPIESDNRLVGCCLQPKVVEFERFMLG